MSTKSTIILTSDNEHWYNDCVDYLNSNGKTGITLEFAKKNIRMELNDDEDLCFTITNPDCEIYKVLEQLSYILRGGDNPDKIIERLLTTPSPMDKLIEWLEGEIKNDPGSPGGIRVLYLKQILAKAKELK